MPPQEHIDLLTEAHRRLLETVAGLANPDVARPSRLPGWTVGHVVTHLARNADSITGMVEAAGRGQVADQYPGGPTQRTDDIDAGAKRSARALGDDLRTAVERLEAALAATDDGAWATGRGRTATAGEVDLPEIVFRRLREVEVHHVDLDRGYDAGRWSAAFVDEELRRGLQQLDGRLSGSDRAAFAAWLLGRATPDAWPELGPWS
jgi:maleylpyruvate isomerase